MTEVTVDLNTDSLYSEPDSALYRFKRRLTLKTILSLTRRIIRTKRDLSMLEIGTGSGYFISFIESEFPEVHVTGLEYDPRLAELTKQKVGRARVLEGNAEHFSLPGEVFDLIVSMQVIEHLYHPEEMLNAVRAHLAPGGRFILTAPNVGCLSARLMKERWHGFRADHVTLRDRAGWVALVEQHGFRTVYSGSTFFSGIPLLNRVPFGILNWMLLFVIGALPWGYGESFIGVFEGAGSK